jgi:hypothetical protein
MVEVINMSRQKEKKIDRQKAQELFFMSNIKTV